MNRNPDPTLTKSSEQAGHTPGDWQVAYWLGTINGGAHQALAVWPADIEEPFRGDPICLVSNVDTQDAMDESNAALIAAAPELFEACKAALPHHQGGHSEVGRLLRAAISKAQPVSTAGSSQGNRVPPLGKSVSPALPAAQEEDKDHLA